MMLHSSLLKGTLKGVRIHCGKSVRKSIVQVRGWYEFFREGHHNKELLLSQRPLQGEGKRGKYTYTWGFFISPEYSVTREKTGYAEFRS